MSRPRGTTMRVEDRRCDEWRKQPWVVTWNKYEPGRVGRPKAKSASFATEAAARQFVADSQAAAESEPVAPVVETRRRAGTLGALAAGWLADVKADRDDSTHDSYADTVKNWLAPEQGHKRYPGLGTLMVTNDTFDRVTIKAYLQGLQRSGATLATRHRCQRAISAFASWALGKGHLRGIANPAFGLGRELRHKNDALAEDAEVHPFTSDEVSRILDELTASEDVCYLVYLQFLLDIGVRPGEASALKWDAILWDKRKVKIELSWSPKAKADKLPKIHERRIIDLTQRVIEMLRAWQAEQRKEAFRRGRPVPAYVFTSRRLARLLQDGNIQLVLDRVLAHVNIEGHRLYDFRHTFATSHLSQDWVRKLEWVSKQLGHKTPETTTKHYYANLAGGEKTAGFADEIVEWAK